MVQTQRPEPDIVLASLDKRSILAGTAALARRAAAATLAAIRATLGLLGGDVESMVHGLLLVEEVVGQVVDRHIGLRKLLRVHELLRVVDADEVVHRMQDVVNTASLLGVVVNWVEGRDELVGPRVERADEGAVVVDVDDRDGGAARVGGREGRRQDEGGHFLVGRRKRSPC